MRGGESMICHPPSVVRTSTRTSMGNDIYSLNSPTRVTRSVTNMGSTSVIDMDHQIAKAGGLRQQQIGGSSTHRLSPIRSGFQGLGSTTSMARHLTSMKSISGGGGLAVGGIGTGGMVVGGGLSVGTSGVTTANSTRHFVSGQQTVIGGYVEESRGHVLSERVVEHEIRVPKRVLREDIVEKVIIVPEKVVHEEVVEDVQLLRQKIVEVAKVIYQEKIVEVPQIEYRERLVEVPEVVVQEKVREVPRLEIQERIIEIPKYVTQEKIVEVPEIEYREISYEKVVEIPEIREQVVLKQIPVPQYVERPVPDYVNVEVEQEITRNVPVPVELITSVNFVVPRIRSRYCKVEVPLYVPRFIEVMMPAEMMDSQSIAQAEHYAQQVAIIASQPAASLCEVERIAGTVKEMSAHYANLGPKGTIDLNKLISTAWSSGVFKIDSIHNIPFKVLEHERVEILTAEAIEGIARNVPVKEETCSSVIDEVQICPEAPSQQTQTESSVAMGTTSSASRKSFNEGRGGQVLYSSEIKVVKTNSNARLHAGRGRDDTINENEENGNEALAEEDEDTTEEHGQPQESLSEQDSEDSPQEGEASVEDIADEEINSEE